MTEETKPTAPETEASANEATPQETAPAQASPEAGASNDVTPSEGVAEAAAGSEVATSEGEPSAESAETAPAAEASAEAATPGGASETPSAETDGAETDGAVAGEASSGAETGDAESGDAEAAGEGAKKKKKRKRKKKKKAGGDPAKAHERAPFHVGEEVFGKVTAVLETAIMIDLSGKALAIFDRGEMEPDDLIPEVGDRFVGQVLGDGGRGGLVVLTRKPLREEEAKPKAEAAAKDGTLLNCLVTGVIKGGVEVLFEGLRAFAPASGVDLHPRTANLQNLVGQRLDFKVSTYDKQGREVVVTRRPMLEKEAHERRKKAREVLQEGAEMDGVVRTVVEWGAFVAMPEAENLEGLVHISEVSHNPRDRIADVLKPGQKIKVQIQKIDDKGKIWLSRKALVDDPFAKLVEGIKPGDIVEGEVTRVEEFGAFVKISDGFEGLCHAADLSVDRVNDAREVIKAGDKVKMVVHHIDQKQRRVALHPTLSEEHAGEAWRLSEALDLGLDDPDAQGALLLAGYEYLVLGRFEEATQVFERLLEVLPGDLALCHGARIAAARVNRPDLEAITSCELARATEDNLKSAALWERAGVLFQDELDDREEAEKCFTAALSRSPGSRVSFERVYRFARDRNDRSRQVELIDARLDTADSESLRIELYWEKARFCRMLGRRTIALRALDELLKLAPDHLPAMALAAELHLVDGRIDAAAETLKAVALHPDTPASQRGAAGLHACDLFEQLRRHRDAVELLQVLDEYGVSGSAGLERQARSLARSEDWGEAYKTFANLNDEQDEIETRLESARMMLAIQRDHLKDPEELKRSARCVLRDSPLDSDAIQIVLEQNFAPEERRRLLTPARGQSREILRRNPLNPPEIRRFAGLCLDCGEDYLERIALGLRGLTGKLSGSAQVRLDELLTNCLRLPSQPLSDSDIEAISDPLLLGATGRFLTLLAPYLSEELEPSLEALGFSSLMRTDEFSGSPHRAEIGTWMGCFGLNDFELYVGGNDPHLISSRQSDLPTILVGKDVAVPLQPKDRARVVTQLAALRRGTAIYLNQSPEELKKWLMASEILVGGTPPGGKTDELSELARLLSKVIPRETREELGNLYTELSRAGVELSLAPFAAMRSAARAACLAQGEPKILRELSDIIPSDQDLLNASMSDVVRFILSGEFITIRRRIGLEGA